MPNAAQMAVAGGAMGAAAGGPAGAAIGAGAGAAFSLLGGSGPSAPNVPNIFEKERYWDPESNTWKTFDRGSYYHIGGDPRWSKDRENEAMAQANSNLVRGGAAEQRAAEARAAQGHGMAGLYGMQQDYEAYLKGQRKSLAEEQLAYGLTQANQNAAAMAGSARGYGGGMAALRGAQMSQQQQTSDALGQGAMLRAREEESARQNLANLYQQDFANRFEQQKLSDAEKAQYDAMVQYWRNQGLDVAKAQMMAYDLMNQRVLENVGVQTSAATGALQSQAQMYGADMSFLGTGLGAAGRIYAAKNGAKPAGGDGG